MNNDPFNCGKTDSDRLVVAQSEISSKTIDEFYSELAEIKTINYGELKKQCKDIFVKNSNYDKVNNILVELAYIGEKWALEIINKYVESNKNDEWANIALCEAKRRIEEDICDYSPWIISSGLGGAGDSIRYIFVIKWKNYEHRTDTMVTESWNKVAIKDKTIIEEIIFKEKYLWIQALIKMNIAVGCFIEDGIGEVNRKTQILEENYLVTNVKIPTENEIEEFISE
jgi:hypothetical protein